MREWMKDKELLRIAIGVCLGVVGARVIFVLFGSARKFVSGSSAEASAVYIGLSVVAVITTWLWRTKRYKAVASVAVLLIAGIGLVGSYSIKREHERERAEAEIDKTCAEKAKTDPRYKGEYGISSCIFDEQVALRQRY